MARPTGCCPPDWLEDYTMVMMIKLASLVPLEHPQAAKLFRFIFSPLFHLGWSAEQAAGVSCHQQGARPSSKAADVVVGVAVAV